MDTKQLAKIAKALSHPNRLEIFLSIIKENRKDFESSGCGGCCVSDFMEKLGIGAPTVSHHLKELVNADLIHTERNGKFLIARPNLETWAKVKDTLFPEG